MSSTVPLAVAAGLVALAAWSAGGRVRPPRRGRTAGATRHEGARAGGGSPGDGEQSWSPVRRRLRRRPEPDVGLLLTEVASRLRAGATPDTAWRAALDRAGLAPAGRGRGPRPGADDVLGEPGVPRPLAELLRRPVRDPAVRAAPWTVVAACRLTHEVGAPLAQVLDRCAQSITEAREAHDARRVAMAGPSATARILAVLPLVGLLLGVGLGADPVRVAADGGWGSASVLLGVLLVAVGRWWSVALVRAARHPGGGSRRPAPAPPRGGRGHGAGPRPRRRAAPPRPAGHPVAARGDEPR